MPTKTHALGTYIRITSVDSQTWTGREYHPVHSDIGQLGVVLSRDLEPGDAEAGEEPVTFYMCLMRSGELRNLVDYEVVQAPTGLDVVPFWSTPAERLEKAYLAVAAMRVLGRPPLTEEWAYVQGEINAAIEGVMQECRTPEHRA